MFQCGQRCDVDGDRKEASETYFHSQDGARACTSATIRLHTFRKFRNYDAKLSKRIQSRCALDPSSSNLLHTHVGATSAPKVIARSRCICQSLCQLARISQHRRYFEAPLEMSSLAPAYRGVLVSMRSVRYHIQCKFTGRCCNSSGVIAVWLCVHELDTGDRCRSSRQVAFS